eukprot:TRINITY_DN1436_c0_g1_i1.p3 TRINITY_DN1436_c0_g1~~TRINITY_DN1436_c0_g1_i1.p3  ORF type:complete len:131 (-),score=2.38 TRINITY_DN1436_c0_g1_i1:544-936(-)
MKSAPTKGHPHIRRPQAHQHTFVGRGHSRHATVAETSTSEGAPDFVERGGTRRSCARAVGPHAACSRPCDPESPVPHHHDFCGQRHACGPDTHTNLPPPALSDQARTLGRATLIRSQRMSSKLLHHTNGT